MLAPPDEIPVEGRIEGVFRRQTVGRRNSEPEVGWERVVATANVGIVAGDLDPISDQPGGLQLEALPGEFRGIINLCRQAVGITFHRADLNIFVLVGIDCRVEPNFAIRQQRLEAHFSI